MAKDVLHGRLRGIVLLIVSACLFAVVDGVSKMLADSQSLGQIMWARYAFALPVLLIATPRTHWPRLFHTRRLVDQIIRGVVPLVIGGAMVLAVRYLPLAEATVILYAGPFLVVALSGPFLGERVSLKSWLAVAVGFIAVVIVARPGFSELSHYIVFPLVAAFFYALFHLFTRRLGAAGEAPHTTLAWTVAIGLIVTTPAALFAWVPMSAYAWGLIATLGITFGLAQIMTIQAFTHAPANVLTPFSYAQIIAATVFGIAVFGAVPDFWTLFGIALMIAAGAYVMHHREEQP